MTRQTVPKQSYETFIRAFIAFFFLFPAGLAYFNYHQDPNHRYRFSVPEETLLKLVNSPDFVLTVPQNYDDRAFLKKSVRLVNPPATLVLGGSRVLNIQTEMFADSRRPVLNAGVTAGTIRDYIAAWQLVKQTGFRPSTVILGIEEQSLNGVSQNDRYLSLLEYYEAFFQKDFSLRVKFMGVTTDFKDLLSLQTTVASFKSIFSDRKEESRLIPKKEYQADQGARTSSFGILYPKSYENKPVATVQNQANANGRGELKVFEAWNTKDRRGYDQLIALIRDIKKSGAAPIIIGMPYHPEAYRLINESPKAAGNLRIFADELQRIAEKEKVDYYDAIIQHQTDFKPEDFMDGVHLKALPNYRLFRKAAEAAGIPFINNHFPEEFEARN